MGSTLTFLSDDKIIGFNYKWGYFIIQKEKSKNEELKSVSSIEIWIKFLWISLFKGFNLKRPQFLIFLVKNDE